jgi:hypothetical protein
MRLSLPGGVPGLPGSKDVIGESIGYRMILPE